MELMIDPEFKALIRRLSHEEYRGLEESILEEGCRDPLVVWGNTLVDGHHRYEICTVHDIPFNTVQREFASRSDAKIWIAKNQFAKLNLSNWDRCMLGLSLEDAFREKAKEQHSLKHTVQYKENAMVQNSAPLSEFNTVQVNKTREEVAKIAGVSHDTIAKAKVIQKKATPEQITRLENREVSITAIYTEIQKEKQEQAQLREETEPQKELPVSTETPAPDQADKQDAPEQTQQQSEPDKEPTNVQVATEPGEPNEPAEPSELVKLRISSACPQNILPSEPSKEPAKEPEEESEPSALEIIQSIANQEIQQEPEGKQESEEEQEPEREPEPEKEPERQQETEEDSDPNRNPKTAHPEAVYFCNNCDKYFKINGRTTCPECGSSDIAFSDWHAECAYRPGKPLKEVLTFCPCGCGYGIDPDEEKWYSPAEMEGKYV